MREEPTPAELADRAYWEKEARHVLKSVLERHGYLYKTLAEKLSTKEVPVTETALKAKINRGTFTFGFFLKVMNAIGVQKVDITKR